MSGSSFCFPPFRLDVGNAQLWQEKQQEQRKIFLRRKTLAVLQYLVTHAGQLVTKDHLLTAVWPGTYVQEGALAICMTELRKALGDNARKPRFIETVHGQGYRFLPAVTLQSVQRSTFNVPRSETQDSGLSTQPSLLVGRESALARLNGYLEKALSGERQLVFVTGEPGIGKTTLLEVFLSRVQGPESQKENQKSKACPEPFDYAQDRRSRRSKRQGAKRDNRPPTPNTQHPTPEVWVGWGQCIEQYGASEPYLPILDALGRLGRRPDGERLTAVLEDLHWSDVSTLDFLAFLVRRKEPARLLVIGTYRPTEILSDRHSLKSVTQELYGHQLAAELPLDLLREADVEAYLGQRFDAEAQLQPLAQPLSQRSGGNPLFLVSLVNDLIARGALTHTEEGWIIQDHSALDGIPDTIRHLVARQRERLLREDQHLLEAASAASLEFSAATVAAALERQTAGVEQQCERLAERQQFLRRAGVAEWPDGTLAARYGFLHALYQQLWHERVSPQQLQDYHLRIGKRKEQAYGERARQIATELAVHFEQGRDYRKAVHYLQQAGENAMRRSAHQEAVTHLTKGVEILKRLPDTPDQAQQECALQITLGSALPSVKGYTAPEVGHAYARAYTLCQGADRLDQLVEVLAGLRGFYLVRGEVRKAREVAEQRLRFAQRIALPTALMRAHYGLGEVLAYQGEFPGVREHLEQAWRLYSALEHSRTPNGDETGVPLLSRLALTLWTLGYADQSQQRLNECLTVADRQARPFGLVFALSVAGWLYAERGEWQIIRERSAEVICLSTDQGFPYFVAYGTAMQGWALVEQGQVEEGIAQLQEGLASLQAAGAELGRLDHFPRLVAAYAKAGRIQKGLVVLTEALSLVEKTGARSGEAELYRLQGEFLLAQQGSRLQAEGSRGKTEEARACFQQALGIARRQQAKSLELRAATSLARLWQQQGKKKKARTMLTDIYTWFTDGFETKDLQEAKALIEELGY